jgi:hypothetical protein
MNQVLEAKKIESMADVEIGHILKDSWGYDQTNIDYYKVIRKTAAMVEIRKIGQKLVERDSDMSEYVVADADNELFDSAHMSRAEAVKRGAEIVSEMDGGNYVYARFAAISKHKARFSNGKLYVRIESFSSASSWDGQADFQSHWA